MIVDTTTPIKISIKVSPAVDVNFFFNHENFLIIF